jgi:hypothetical protein
VTKTGVLPSLHYHPPTASSNFHNSIQTTSISPSQNSTRPEKYTSMAEQTSERPVWPAQCTRYGVQLSCGHCTTIWIDHTKTCFDARADAKKVSKATGQPSTWEKCTPVPKRETQSYTAKTGKVKLEDGTFSNQCSMCRPQGSPEEEAREVETQSGE